MSRYPQVSENPEVQARYEACRRAGSSHRVSEMLAFKQSPSLQTDTRWLSGHHNGNQFTGSERAEAAGKYYRQVAREHGVPTEGAVYKSQLARFPGDPKAWVRSKADCIKVAAERGMTLEGGVNYKPPEGTRDVAGYGEEPYRVADSIVDREYEALCDQEPDAAAMKPEDLKEQIREQLSPGPDE